MKYILLLLLSISYERGVDVQSISIYNSTGKLEYQFFQKIDKIDISKLPVGVYHIQFDLFKSKQSCSFVKR